MTFLIDNLLKAAVVKIFGKSTLFTFNNGKDSENGFYDPYFELIKEGNDFKLIQRPIPKNIPIELTNEITKIRKLCYWMDESLFGIKSSTIMNKLFGFKIDIHASDDNAETRMIKSRRLGFGFGPFLQIVPFIGNYLVLLINTWILYCMFSIGFGIRINLRKGKFSRCENNVKFLKVGEFLRMIFNVVVDFGIGFIPFVGLFVSIIHRSSSRNLAIFWRSMEKEFSDQVEGLE